MRFLSSARLQPGSLSWRRMWRTKSARKLSARTRFKFIVVSTCLRQNRSYSTLAKAPHHLIGTVPLTEEMNAEKYRRAAMRAIEEINLRGKLAIVVGGSGLYIKALTHGLAPLPESDPELREKLNAMSLDDLTLPTCRTRSRNGTKNRSQKPPSGHACSGDLSGHWETRLCTTPV